MCKKCQWFEDPDARGTHAFDAPEYVEGMYCLCHSYLLSDKVRTYIITNCPLRLSLTKKNQVLYTVGVEQVSVLKHESARGHIT